MRSGAETAVLASTADALEGCILCGSSDLEIFLDLGETALANKFRAEMDLSQPEPSFPLRVAFCNECRHVQLPDRVPPSAMFEDYLYVSSASTRCGTTCTT